MNTHLTPEQINQSIAEFCGTEIKDGWFVTYRSPKHGDAVWAPVSELPNYHGDLNACREAVLLLPENLHSEFHRQLYIFTKPAPDYMWRHTWAFITASPEIICEALLKTLGKHHETTRNKTQNSRTPPASILPQLFSHEQHQTTTPIPALQTHRRQPDCRETMGGRKMTCIASTIAALRKAGFLIEFPHRNASVIKPSDLRHRNRNAERVRKNNSKMPGWDTSLWKWEDYCTAARKALKLHLEGESMSRACYLVGLSTSLSTGIGHVKNQTAVFFGVKAGKVPKGTARHVVSFIRWHEGILPPSKVHGDDTERLRERLKRVDYVLVDLEARSGVHHTSIMKFRNGSVKGMRPGTRAKLWEALGGDK